MGIMVGPSSPFPFPPGQLMKVKKTAGNIQHKMNKGIVFFMAGLHSDMEMIDCGEKLVGRDCCSEKWRQKMVVCYMNSI